MPPPHVSLVPPCFADVSLFALKPSMWLACAEGLAHVHRNESFFL